MSIVGFLLAIVLGFPALAFGQDHATSFWELTTKQPFKGRADVIEACWILEIDNLSSKGATALVQCGWLEKDGSGAVTATQPLSGHQIDLSGETFVDLALTECTPGMTYLQGVMGLAYSAMAAELAKNETPADPSDDVDFSGTLRAPPLPMR